MLPPPEIREHDGVLVVRDDLLPGGTKRRVIGRFLLGADEFVYASPAYGHAQIALALACRDAGKRATIFTAQRASPHPMTRETLKAGAKIVMVPSGYLSNVQAKAREYCRASGAVLFPFGMAFPAFVEALAGIARSLPVSPREFWSVAGSGTLSRALQMAWPGAKAMAVRVGKRPDCGAARLFVAPERFEAPCAIPPPFPSSLSYDAKAWRFVRQFGTAGALFWNVGS